MKSFKTFNLCSELFDNITYETPTPIQSRAIPLLMEGNDLLGIAQTGTGKTAAFAIPIINKILENKSTLSPKSMRALILTPTRELASQIKQNISDLTKGLNVKSTVIFGGVNSYKQIQSTKDGIDIVVATPGRLIDLTLEKRLSYKELEFLVLDEADKMLDMGFIGDIKRIIKYLPENRQTLLFSATMPKEIGALADNLLNAPKKIQITPQATTAEKISQSLYFLSKENKLKMLVDILQDSEVQSALVFTRTKHGADRVARKLTQANIQANAIHGNKSQNNREKTLHAFRNKEVRVLIATDIAARGIDVDHITHIINFNLPEDPSSYVHRIGRTGRAGKSGVAISFCDGSELSLLHSIEKHIKSIIPKDNDHKYFEDLHSLQEKAGKTPQDRRGQISKKKKLSMSKKARRRRSFRG